MLRTASRNSEFIGYFKKVYPVIFLYIFLDTVIYPRGNIQDNSASGIDKYCFVDFF